MNLILRSKIVPGLILDVLFPKKCYGCGKSGIYLCQDCISNIKQADLVCPFCEHQSVGGQTHPVCRRLYGLDGLWSLGIYRDPLQRVIQKLKYKYIQELSKILVDITLDRFSSEIKDKNWIVVPVPLHWYRENKRGFNQSSLIGKDLAKRMGLQYMEALKRVQYTKQQVGLKGHDRQQNIRGVFELSMNHEPKTLNYILVDDVWTTGSTLKECCLVLKQNGAKKVWALTLAR